ncbi:YqaJ viral recombinase family protein [Zooshikella sp. RANM57]|uniref:YqaJ viral recombinase family nuclease n=1 Tax=Zooshikella sp. RANM57 TaxID=3425863 RepID=UPI003D6E7132
MAITLNEQIKQHNAYINRVILSIPNFGMLEGEEKFLANRRLSIGGSDVGAILGISKYKTPYAVWLEKTGRAEPQKETKHMHFGKVLESVVADEYERVTGNKVHKVNQTLACKSMPWLTANLDRRVVYLQKVLECKTTNPFSFKRDDWGEGNQYTKTDHPNTPAKPVVLCDGIPDMYLLQCQHYLTVTGYLEADLAVLIGGNDLRIYTIVHNEMLAGIVAQRLTDFWFNHVIADVPPEPTTPLEVDEFYGSKHDNGESITATDEVLEALEELKKAKEVKKKAENIVKEKESIIKRHMGENQQLIDDSGNKLASWKTYIKSSFQVTKFKENHPELAINFTEKTENRTFRV